VRELALHVLDLLQNAREAGATRVRLSVEEDRTRDRLTIRVEDNGRGMKEEAMRQARDPFYTTRTTRHVGLGLPLLAAAAERCDGSLALASVPGQGTRVTAEFRLSHLDRAPLGDLPGTLTAFLLGEPFCHLEVTHRRDGNEWSLDTRPVLDAIAPVPVSHPAVREWLTQTLHQAEARLDLPADRSPENGGRDGEEGTCRS